LQADLDAALATINEDSLRVFETQITSSKSFQEGVAETRKVVGIYFPTYHESGRNGAEINADILLDRNKLSEKRVREIIESEKFKKCVDKLMQNTGLPNHWREYVIAYITGQPIDKESLTVFTNEHILLESIDDNSLTVKIKKGTRYDEYIKAWDSLSKHLGKGRRKDSSRDNAARDLQMYHSFYYRGLSLKEIAKLYLNTDVEYGVDTVKKAIRRQKKLFDEGTDLAQ
jgi:hypothetical protein